MKRFYFNKLVRDKIIEKNASNPDVMHTEYKVLNSVEYRQVLRKKIAEELDEVMLSDSDREEVTAELGDLQTVVSALRDSFGITEQEVSAAVSVKAAEAGEFSLKHFIDYVDIVDDSKWVEIFRSQPGKYRENNADFPFIEKGIYRHSKKGHLYEVLGIALQTETSDPMVIYRPLYDNEYELFARPYAMFIEQVELNGTMVPRFEKVQE